MSVSLVQSSTQQKTEAFFAPAEGGRVNQRGQREAGNPNRLVGSSKGWQRDQGERPGPNNEGRDAPD